MLLATETAESPVTFIPDNVFRMITAVIVFLTMTVAYFIQDVEVVLQLNGALMGSFIGKITIKNNNLLNFSIHFACAVFRKSMREFFDEKSKMEISSKINFLYWRFCFDSRSLSKFTGDGRTSTTKLYACC